MKKGSMSLGYLTKEGFRNLRVNKLMTLASVTVLFSCMFLMGIAYMIYVNIDALVSGVEAENVIMVYIEDGADTQAVTVLELSLQEIPNVEKCEFISRGQAYSDIIDSMGDSGKYLEGLDNPLPDAYKVTVKDMTQFKQTVSEIKKLDNVMRVRQNGDLADKLAKARNTITYISGVIIGLLFLVSLFIISNTIKITMFSRRLEISIMKSVGATNRFIRWPFLVEGVLIGIISAILATGGVWGVYTLAAKYLLSSAGLLTGSAVNILSYLPFILVAFLALGLFSGVFGSANSIRKYLKERKFVELEDV